MATEQLDRVEEEFLGEAGTGDDAWRVLGEALQQAGVEYRQLWPDRPDPAATDPHFVDLYSEALESRAPVVVTSTAATQPIESGTI